MLLFFVFFSGIFKYIYTSEESNQEDRPFQNIKTEMAHQLTPPYTPPDLMDGIIDDDHFSDNLDNFLPMEDMDGFSSPPEDNFLDQKPVVTMQQNVVNSEPVKNQLLLQTLLTQPNLSGQTLQQLNAMPQQQQQQQNDVSLLDILQQPPKRLDTNTNGGSPSIGLAANQQVGFFGNI